MLSGAFFPKKIEIFSSTISNIRTNYKLTFCFNWFIILRLFKLKIWILFVSFGLIFQDVSSLTHTHTKLFTFQFTISTSCTSTPLYIPTYSPYSIICQIIETNYKWISISFNINILWKMNHFPKTNF